MVAPLTASENKNLFAWKGGRLTNSSTPLRISRGIRRWWPRRHLYTTVVAKVATHPPRCRFGTTLTMIGTIGTSAPLLPAGYRHCFDVGRCALLPRGWAAARRLNEVLDHPLLQWHRHRDHEYPYAVCHTDAALQVNLCCSACGDRRLTPHVLRA